MGVTTRSFEDELLTAIDQLIYARQREWSGWIAHNKMILRDLIVATVLDVRGKRIAELEEWERVARGLGNAVLVNVDGTPKLQGHSKFIEAFLRHLRKDLIDAPESYPARAMVVRMLTLEAERDAALAKLENP